MEGQTIPTQLWKGVQLQKSDLSFAEYNNLESMTTCTPGIKGIMMGTVCNTSIVDFGSGEAKMFQRDPKSDDKHQSITSYSVKGDAYKTWQTETIEAVLQEKEVEKAREKLVKCVQAFLRDRNFPAPSTDGAITPYFASVNLLVIANPPLGGVGDWFFSEVDGGFLAQTPPNIEIAVPWHGQK